MRKASYLLHRFLLSWLWSELYLGIYRKPVSADLKLGVDLELGVDSFPVED